MNYGILVLVVVLIAGACGLGGFLIGKNIGYDRCIREAMTPVSVNVKCPMCQYGFSVKVERK